MDSERERGHTRLADELTKILDRSISRSTSMCCGTFEQRSAGGNDES